MDWYRLHDVLMHHGIKGQKWGVRNGPPYPIEDKVYAKGQKLRSVANVVSSYTPGIVNSKAYLEHLKRNKRFLYTYNPEDPWDEKVYTGPFAKYLLKYRGARNLELHEFEIKEDLKMPTKKERVDAYIKLVQKANKKDLDELENVRKMLVEENVGSTKTMKEKIKNLNIYDMKTDDDFIVGYEVFSHAMEAAHQFKITKMYCDYMAKNFDAMVDDNNQGIYNRAHDPVVIMNLNKLIASDKVQTDFNMNTVIQNCDFIEKELAKVGERVKL